MTDRPWELLASSDAPRPLPPALRSSLESLLLDRAAGDPSSESAAAQLVGADTPRPLPSGLRDRLEAGLPQRRTSRRAVAAWLAAAAAAAVVATVPLLVDSGHQPAQVAGGRPAQPTVTTPPALSGGAATGSSTGGTAVDPGPRPIPSPLTPSSRAPVGIVPGPPPAHARPSEPAAAAARPAAPTVTGLTPSHGPATGGTWVTVTGTGLTGVTKLVFGTTAAAQVQVVSDRELRVLSPAHLPGEVDVLVTTSSGTSKATEASRFLYLA